MSLAEVVREAAKVDRAGMIHGEDGHTGTEPVKDAVSDSPVKNTEPQTPTSYTSPQRRRSSLSDTPALRTGPPRSISYNYSLPQSPESRQTSHYANGDIPEVVPEAEDTEFPFFSPGDKDFRGALEFGSPEQKEREREAAEKKGKERESRLMDSSWNPIKWFHESPREEKSGFDIGERKDEARTASHEDIQNQTMDEIPSEQVTEKPERGVQRSYSLPHRKSDKTARGTAKWGRLRSLLPTVTNQGKSLPGGQAAITPQNVNITDELMVGGLSTMMLRLWFERDEKDRRRIPILFHRLRIRISDSLHPMHGHKSVFRIECEYANGAARWVIYRQLRDFISLHTHYTFSNAYNRNIDSMPEFPRTSWYSIMIILTDIN
jgi:phospholipase D1/2